MLKFKKVIAVVLTLTVAISMFAINASASSTISRIVDGVGLLVDAIKFQNNHWDDIGHILGDNADGLDADDVSKLLGGADLDDVIDLVKMLGNAGIDGDALSEVINQVAKAGTKISIDDLIDLIVSSSSNPGVLDTDLIKDVLGCLKDSKVDAGNLGDILKVVIGSIDWNNGIDQNGLGNIFKIIIDAIKNIVGNDAQGSTGSSDITSSTVTNTNNKDWTGTWSTSMVNATVNILEKDISVSLVNITARNRVMSTISGDVIRITLSNEYGVSPLKIGEVTAAIGDEGLARAVKRETMVKVTFGGSESVTIPAGQKIVSDPIKLSVKALDDIVISMYFPKISTFKTVGLIGGHCYASLGNTTENYVSAASIDLALENLSVGAYEIIPVLSNIDVYTADVENARACVFFGDSTLANTIPQRLAKRLQANGITNVGVLQQAIKGNEILRDGQGLIGNILGKSGLKRFYNDAIAQPGVKYIFVKIGANDILHPNCSSLAANYPDGVNLDAIIDAYKQLIDMAHKNGKEIYFMSRTPFKGYTRNILGITGDDLTWSWDIWNDFLALNTWLQSSDCLADGYIDLLPVISDPSDPTAVLPEFTLDGVHFTPAGCQAIVDMFPLSIFTKDKDKNNNSSNNNGNSGNNSNNNTSDVPAAKDPSDPSNGNSVKDPTVTDPSVTDEVLQDVEIVDSIVTVDDETPLAPMITDGTLDPNNFAIANTSVETGAVAGVSVAALAAVAFVTAVKKKED